MVKISRLSLVRNTEPDGGQPRSVEELRTELMEAAASLAAYALDPRKDMNENEPTFKAFEESLIPMVFALARLAITLFLTAAEQRVSSRTGERVERRGRILHKNDPNGRNLETVFGVVRYWRTYMRERGDGPCHGYYPLDVELGLAADRVSLGLLGMAVRLATKLSFDEVRTVLGWLLPTVPSTEVIQNATLGLGRYTQEYFESAPPPEDDGEVLIIQVDSKGIPTATDTELERRRGPRRSKECAASPRHRGRSRRGRYGSKPRRKKGDKSKNAKMATLVVMYTLRRSGTKLLGPINKWVYASFAPKKHAFAIAWREARKRGFDPDGDNVIQIVTDGDDDLARYARYFFPKAIHTLDVMHAIEKLWIAGQCLYREGSDELKVWVEEQKNLMYSGAIDELLDELRARLAAIPKTGPGNKGKRERLGDVISYLDKRVDMMNYAELDDADLEIGSGAVEGAVKFVIAIRCDHGGMRWIKERGEAVVQLRCIEINGDWDRFLDFVQDRISEEQRDKLAHVRIQQKTPAPLPELIDRPEMKEAA